METPMKGEGDEAPLLRRKKRKNEGEGAIIMSCLVCVQVFFCTYPIVPCFAIKKIHSGTPMHINLEMVLVKEILATNKL